MGTTASLTFSSEQPIVVELSGKRNIASNDAPSGSIRNNTEFSIDVKDDDKKLLVARVSLIVEGIVEKSDDIAFTIRSIVECRFRFPDERVEEEFEDHGKMRVLCEPLYHRASMLAQDMAWKMGYTAVKLPIMFPNKSSLELVKKKSDNKPATVSKSQAKKTVRKIPK